MRIVDGDAIQQQPARENGVPRLLHARHATAAEVVHLRMPVEDFEQPVVPDLLQFLARDRPAEIRMVDVRQAAFAPRMASTLRCSTSTTEVPPCGSTRASHVEPVDVERLFRQSVGDLFAFDDQKSLVGAMDGIQPVDGSEEVVVGQDEKLISVLAIPAHDFFGSRIAVAVESMGVGVALVPREPSPALPRRLSA